MSAPKIYFGAGLFMRDQGYNSGEDIKPWLAPLLESKDIICGMTAPSSMVKLTGGGHSTLLSTKENVIAQANESLTKLGIKQFGILFLHAPDARVPVEETLSGFDALYKEGKFKHFGLSNQTAEQIDQVVQACKANNFVLPTVFQGRYNPVARIVEDELLPTLRKHNIMFVAYSPMAGGFLAKPTDAFRNHPDSFQGRWDREGFLGKVHHYLYNQPLLLQALDKWHTIAKDEGITGAEMAYRWVAYHSALTPDDGMVVGATTIEQWKSNVAGILKGPLSAQTASQIDALWTPELKADSLLDNWEAIKALIMSPM
ncbi:hypothetical protein G7054_g2173 [Neopestalotiopsis clavispora]|nr:hypothetical protein G7054_g2173 [Neopestalotiopsis clavispora]